MKRRPAPTNEEIEAAIARAKAGKGRQLALLVKSFSADDLAIGFSRAGTYSFGFYDPFWAVKIALVYASGMKSERENFARLYRETLKKRVAAEKAAEAGA